PRWSTGSAVVPWILLGERPKSRGGAEHRARTLAAKSGEARHRAWGIPLTTAPSGPGEPDAGPDAGRSLGDLEGTAALAGFGRHIDQTPSTIGLGRHERCLADAGPVVGDREVHATRVRREVDDDVAAGGVPDDVVEG